MAMRGAFWVVLLAVGVYAAQYLSVKEFPVHKKGAVLITGCSSGIGRDAAFAIAKEGYSVFAGVRSDSQATELKEEATASKIDLRPLILDVTKHDQVLNSVKSVEDFLSKSGLPLVAVINNAGINVKIGLPVEYSDVDEARHLYEVNYFGALDVTKQFIPLLRQHKGRIVNVGSIAGMISRPYAAIYSSSKYALKALTISLRRELRQFDVAVSLLSPGYIESRMLPKKVDGNRRLKEHLSPSQYKLYQKYFDAYHEKQLAPAKFIGPTSLTSEAILDAIRSPRPRPNYVVGPVHPLIPTALVDWLFWILPESLQDLLLVD